MNCLGGVDLHKLTMQQIAEAAKVSCATVSRCLSGREGVGEKTRERVLRICRDMGYSPNFTEAAPHRTGRIGFLVPSLRDPEAAALAACLEEYLAGLGYGMILSQFGSRQQEPEALRRLEAQRVDGVIQIPAGKQFSPTELPRVFLGAHLGDQPVSYVAVDHFLGGQAAVRQLCSLGHRKIFFLAGGDPEVCRRRKSGVDSALRQRKLTAAKNPEEATAVIASDRQLPGTLAGKALVSFDGSFFDRVGIPVSTFDSPENMAPIAASILLEQLERPIGGYSHRMVVPQLHRRGSDFPVREEENHG